MNRLTARSVAAAKALRGKRREIADHIVRGLSLRVTAAGAKSWALRYRNEAGRHPALSLERARAAALGALARVAEGEDPALDRIIKRRAARSTDQQRPATLADLWVQYEAAQLPKKRPSTARYQAWLWRKHLAPRLGDQRVAELRRASIKAALREIGATAPIQANRARGLLRRMLNLAVEEEVLAISPLAGVGRPFTEASRDRVLCDDELQQLWAALDAAPSAGISVSRELCVAIKLILLTGARAGDVAGSAAGEIDPATHTWTVPPDRYKSKRAQVVPLTEMAVALLAEAFGDADPCKWQGHAFPNTRHAATSVRRMSLSRAMQRVVDFAGLSRATLHDLRRTAATYMASDRIGVAPHVIAAVLGHAPEGAAVTHVYLRYRYNSEKRAALTAWVDLLADITRPSGAQDHCIWKTTG